MKGSELSENDKTEHEAGGRWRNDACSLGLSLWGVWAKQKNRDDELTSGAGHVHRSSDESYYTSGGVVGGRIGPDVQSFEDVSMPSNLSPFFFERDLKRWGLSGAIQIGRAHV